MERPINALPPELLSLILTKLRLSSNQDRSNSFVTALRVCTKWRDAGENLLWTDVSLEDDRIGRFSPQSSERLKSIKSLTVLIHPVHYEWSEELASSESDFDENKESPATVTLWKFLEKVPKYVRQMENLTSFSVKVCGYNLKHDPEGFWLRTPDICALVDALTNSVRHLEIDTYCLDRLGTPSATPANHLCPRLRNRLSRVSNMRLRVSRVCEGLVDSKSAEDVSAKPNVVASTVAAKGPAITVNTCNLLGLSYTKSCGEEVEEGWNNLGDETACRKTLTTLLESLIQGSKSAQEFQPSDVALIESCNRPMHAPLSRNFYTAVIKRSLFPAKLAKYPYEWYGWNPDCAFLRLRDREGQDTEINGLLHDLVDEVEDCPWVETDEGYRLPASFFREEARFKHMRLKEKAILNHEAYVRSSMGKMAGSELWLKEERDGRLLLRMVESEDLNAIGCVERDRTNAETKRMQDPFLMDSGNC